MTVVQTCALPIWLHAGIVPQSIHRMSSSGSPSDAEPMVRPPVRPTILMIGSEAVPFAKTGGLADVLGALPAALSRLGWVVWLAIPRYRGVSSGVLSDELTIPLGETTFSVGIQERQVLCITMP